LISAFCFSKILRTLRHHQAQVHGHIQHEKINGEGISLNIARYRKTIYAAVWIEVTLVACYLPYSLVIAIIIGQGSSPFRDAIWASTATLVRLNSSLNPIVYCWKIKEVRQEVKNTVRQLLCLSN
jgi:hypothetical protein